MKILFFGTPEFAIPSLQRLIDDGYEILGAVTQPDRPRGRGRKPAPSPVRELAEFHGIPVFTPEKLRPEVKRFAAMDPDYLVVASYGRILPQTLLDVPKIAPINLHASLLPKYRGPSPIQWAILSGDEVTGNTIMVMVREMDAGPILTREEESILPEDTAGTLSDRLACRGADLLSRTLQAHSRGEITETEQDHNAATYSKLIDKRFGEIDWSRDAAEIHNLVRAMNPWPVAFTQIEGKTIRIWAGRPEEAPSPGHRPGEIICVGKESLTVQCGGGTALQLLEIQAPGGKQMVAGAFLRGHPVAPGTLLGRAS